MVVGPDPAVLRVRRFFVRQVQLRGLEERVEQSTRELEHSVAEQTTSSYNNNNNNNSSNSSNSTSRESSPLPRCLVSGVTEQVEITIQIYNYTLV